MSILNILFGTEEQSDDLLHQKKKEYDGLRKRILLLEREILENEINMNQEEVSNLTEESFSDTGNSQHGVSLDEIRESLLAKEEELKSRELCLKEREEYLNAQEQELKKQIQEFQSSSVGTSFSLDNEYEDERDKAVYSFFESKFQQVNSCLKDLYINKQDISEKDSIIKDLHKELQVYKGDLYKQILSPIILELISWVDKIRNTASYYHQEIIPEQYPVWFKRLRDEYEKLSIQVEDILYNFDIEPYSSQEGEPFNVKRHKAIMTELTVDSEKDKTVKSSIKVGYMDSQEKIIRKEEVVLYKYENNR